LLCTWSSTRWQIVCADSHFASTSAVMHAFQALLFHWCGEDSNLAVSKGLPKHN
jgi:hypothetical protein